MDNNTKRNDTGLPKESDQQIQVIMNRSHTDEASINMGNVFHNMRLKARLFVWVLILCLLLGIAAPLLLYQFTKPPLTVSSVVTLRYETPKKVKKTDENDKEIWVIPDNPEYEMVTDLSAPDGEELDLNQITSTYILQTSLDGMTLSQPITAANLRTNFSIQTVLTEESSRTKEALQGLAEAKNAEVYTRLENAEMKYKNRFIVTLTNGFGGEDSRTKLELTDEELRTLLDRVLTVYNQYLVKTYADQRRPEDKFSGIDIHELDIIESLDDLNTGVQALLSYGEEKTDTVKSYRSWKTGRSLADWTETIRTFKTIGIDSLYATVYGNAITRDKKALLTSSKYLLRNAQNDLQKIKGEIEDTEKILRSYKNDDIYISMQESDGTRTTKAATEYYNSLILQQAKNYEKAREQQVQTANYEDRIDYLTEAKGTEVTEDIEAELANAVTTAQSLYDQVRNHMEELYESLLYTTYEEHSMPQGKEQNFLAASTKGMIIGALAGLVIACGLWFLAGVAPEFARNRNNQDVGKEATEK